MFTLPGKLAAQLRNAQPLNSLVSCPRWGACPPCLRNTHFSRYKPSSSLHPSCFVCISANGCSCCLTTKTSDKRGAPSTFLRLRTHGSARCPPPLQWHVVKVSVSSGNCSFLLSRPAPRSPSVCGLGFSLPLARPISTEAWFRLSSVPERMRRRELGLGAAGSQYRHHIRGGDGSGHCICQRLYRQLAASASHSLSSAVISPGSATAHRCSGGPSPHAAGARAAALAADPTSGTGGAPALPSLSSVASSPPSAAGPRSARPAPLQSAL